MVSRAGFRQCLAPQLSCSYDTDSDVSSVASLRIGAPTNVQHLADVSFETQDGFAFMMKGDIIHMDDNPILKA